MNRALAAALLLAAAPAAADSTDAAREQLQRATALLAEGDHAAAVKAFEAAFAAARDPRLLYSIGQCHQALGDFPRAVAAYTRYLSEVPNAITAREVGQLIDELTPLTFKNAPPPAEDRFPPRIRHAPHENVPAGEALTLEAEILDESAVFEPKLYIRLGDVGAFVPSQLKPTPEGKYVGFIAPLDAGELQYFLEAYDAKGNGPARHGTPSFPHRARILTPARVAAEEQARRAPEVVLVPLLIERAPPPEVVGTAETAGRGPWAFVALGAGALAAGGAAFFGMGAVGAFDGRPVYENVRQDAEGKAQMANVLWTVAGAGAAAAVVFYVLEF